MCIPPATATEEENRGFFQETYQLFVDMKEKLGDNVSNIDCLSMGMSGDYPLAIAGGSTMVRVGTALFGAVRLASPGMRRLRHTIFHKI